MFARLIFKQRLFGMAQRLGSTFSANPWTLVTAISGLVSTLNMLESLLEKFGAKTVLFVPAVGVAVYALPKEMRTVVLATAVALLCSGYL